MRVVLDTNILVSALIAPAGNPAAIYDAWEQGKFIHKEGKDDWPFGLLSAKPRQCLWDEACPPS